MTATTTIEIFPPLAFDVADNAVITVYNTGAIDVTGSYEAGYSDELTVKSFSGVNAVKVGQGVGIGNYMYCVTGVSDNGSNVTGITLNRPLEEVVADDTVVAPIPAGNYGFAFNKQACSFVCAPLKLIPDGLGTAMTVKQSPEDGIAFRMSYGYNIKSQKLMLVIDLLCGVTTLNEDLGAVLLS